MVVSLNRDGPVAVVLIDNPPVNAASHAVRAGIVAALNEANTDPAIGVIVLACAGRTFVAGADIKEFGKPPVAPILPDVCAALEASIRPVVAAMHGTTLGGGLELALACHARIAARDAQMGLPEVKLGLIPGAGGTQRLPRLAGMETAIEMVSGGGRIDAQAAVACGLIDRIAEGDLLEAARDFARTLIGSPPRRTGEQPVPTFDAVAVDARIAAIDKKARGQIAPGRAARLARRAAEVPLAEGLAEERAAFVELLAGPQSAALRYVFAAERDAARIVGLEGVAPREVTSVGIVGAGLMGAGIAAAVLNAGWPLTVVEHDAAAAEAGGTRIHDLIDKARTSGRISDDAVAARLSRLAVSTDRAALTDCDLVIEAVFDDQDVKTALFADLSRIVRPDAILATNTSYLDPDRLAEAVAHPERFVGLHFFSPAHIMRLVEVVETATTSPGTLATAMAVVKRLGKLGVVTGVCEGFIGNRLYTAYRREADVMLEEGALPHEVDAAMEAFGFPMGPYAVNDMAGLDISWARRKRAAATRDPAEPYVVIADRLCQAGRLGRKAGAGYYRYVEGRREVDPAVAAIVEAASAEKEITRRPVAADEIQRRILTALRTEGEALLGEGVARRASDIDLVLINGYGFPAWRGGPMFVAGRT
ncbi:3-hydroxyacyl-CoA dehydrogenase NAD-binding domain-containing protein [Brevundimonas aveniformis]|uniref:3-hydroxyacyl-CoA dehydrogenase NAD-binding domain-containing protein n=1 Tax=Brevundimonas aveniformis TaxID=370977 RepID=UPI0004141170|nr:3-hydroxyacyl-CoA dehydrogenase NAD-binding domain-containing protein [Brevundimonas aveniformis]